MFRLLRIVLVLWLAIFQWRTSGQPAMHSRIFRTAGTYPSLVSAAPNGTILSKSGDSSMVTLLDGYTRRDIAIPEEVSYRVHPSRSGQIWTVTTRGLFLYHAGAWTLYDLPEIRTFLASPARNLRQIALLPAEVGRVLILFPDRLLDFEATTLQTRILKEAASTGLGEFSEIQAGFDESIWISGTHGIALLQGPPRRLVAPVEWTEFLIPETNRVSGLQRVHESAPGELTCSASTVGAESRSIVHFSNGLWTSFPVPGERIRQAWRGGDGASWGFSTISLFQVNEVQPVVTLNRLPVSGALYDVAVETNGVFWVAAGEGLIRYAPYLWRAPVPLADLQSSIHSILFETNAGGMWLSTTAGLVRQTSEGRRTYTWPEEMEALPPRQNICRLGDGRIVIGGQSGLMVLNPETGIFSKMSTPPALHVHLLGSLQDGSLCAWFEHSDRNLPLDIRFFKEGEFQPLQLPAERWNHGDVSFMKEAANGDLWFCLGPSLIRVRKATGAVEHYGPENGLRTERIYALADVGEGRVWCGTASRIYEFRGQRWESVLSTFERVTDIVAARGVIWVATLSGIQRFQENCWLLQGGNEGLPRGPVYALCLSPNEELWAGTSRGAFEFHPDADLDPPRTLPPVVDEVANLTPGEPTVIRFRGQDRWDYTFPSDLSFSSRLDEGSWSAFSNTTSRVFQNLAAGTHVLEVLAMDRNGNKALTSSKLEFSVIVPWSRDPRLVSVSALALVITLILAGFAVNKHLQLKRSYARVEQMVADRTRELQHATQELVHAQKMQALGTMAAGIAHDFNNILSIIKGSAQIIEKNIDDREKIRTRVGRIQMVVEQGTVIVKALLGLGKTERKELSDCDVPELLHQTRKLLSDRFPDTVQFQINTPPELPMIHCAPDVLQQILLNLVLNAAEAMHNQGLVELTATTSKALPSKLALDPMRATAEATWVVVSVIDQGGGIPPEILPRIFEPFFTTKAFSSRRGTGLGLSMVYELAKAEGYGLSVETKVGQGSSFSVIVPAGRAARDWASQR